MVVDVYVVNVLMMRLVLHTSGTWAVAGETPVF